MPIELFAHDHFHSGPQFGSRYGELDKLDFQPWERMRGLTWRPTEHGVLSDRQQRLPDGRALRTLVETWVRGVRGAPNPFGRAGRIDNLGFVLPVDDTHLRIFNVLRGREDTFFQQLRDSRGERERRAAAGLCSRKNFPATGKPRAARGRSPCTLKSTWPRVTAASSCWRRQFRAHMERVRAGQDPIGVAYEPGSELVRLEAGQLFF